MHMKAVILAGGLGARLSEEASDQMSIYFHRDFWQPIDALREKYLLESLWQSGKAPWKIW